MQTDTTKTAIRMGKLYEKILDAINEKSIKNITVFHTLGIVVGKLCAEFTDMTELPAKAAIDVALEEIKASAIATIKDKFK